MDSLSQLRAQHYQSLKLHLLDQYIGRDLESLDGPAAVVDRAVARRNCISMLEAVDALGVGFRAHIKSHKVSDRWKEPKLARLVHTGSNVITGKQLYSQLYSPCVNFGRRNDYDFAQKSAS